MRHYLPRQFRLPPKVTFRHRPPVEGLNRLSPLQMGRPPLHWRAALNSLHERIGECLLLPFPGLLWLFGAAKGPSCALSEFLLLRLRCCCGASLVCQFWGSSLPCPACCPWIFAFHLEADQLCLNLAAFAELSPFVSDRQFLWEWIFAPRTTSTTWLDRTVVAVSWDTSLKLLLLCVDPLTLQPVCDYSPWKQIRFVFHLQEVHLLLKAF